MTAIPGHNQVIQQSGIVQELFHQAAAPKPSPEQAAAQQQDSERLKNTTVQEFEGPEKLKLKNKKDLKGKNEQRKEKRKNPHPSDPEKDPDAMGRLLDTVI